MTKKRRLTDEEIRLWNRFTAGIERIDKDKLPTKPSPQPEARDKTAANSNSQPTESSKRAKVPQAPSASDLANTDRRTWQRLKRGQIAIEGRLDLHGRTQIEAHDALGRFLQTSSMRGLRCVLIVTGKGVDGQGVLRQMVPRWLAEEANRKRVITYCSAHARHGGNGALYVLIRRQRGRSVR
jgi:DNA-nicking Smr family endonuclease